MQVFEETGYNTQHAFPEEQLRAGYVEPEGAERNPYYIEVVIKEQKIRLYFIHDIPEDTYFATQTRKEISVRSFLPSEVGRKADESRAAENRLVQGVGPADVEQGEEGQEDGRDRGEAAKVLHGHALHLVRLLSLPNVSHHH